MSLASKHQSDRVAVSDRTGRRVAGLWRGVQGGDLDAGWDAVAPQMERAVVDGQLVAAKQAPRYVGAVDQSAPRHGVIVPQAFTGATAEGREIVPELYAGVTTTKRLIGAGMGVAAALHAGTAYIGVIAAQMVRDAGNMADKAASVGRGYVLMARVVSPGACSRCAILAGVGYFTRHFERHPGCRCQTIPVHREDVLPSGVFSSPADYFESLSRTEQDRVFTKAGAEAVRLGADPISVVNARRGMFRTQQPGSLVARASRRTVIGPDGVPFDAYTTTEGTSVRGRFGRNAGGGYVRLVGDQYRRTTTVRLMPETILDLADGDQARAVELLKQYGYMR